MRITVYMPDQLAEDVARAARTERKSVSRFVAEAVRWYLAERRRRALGLRVLERAGQARVSPSAIRSF